MARPKRNKGPHIVWRKGRAYADLRAYEHVGGKKEALATRGSTWGTNDPEIALELFEARLAELRARRKGHAGGTPPGSVGQPPQRSHRDARHYTEGIALGRAHDLPLPVALNRHKNRPNRHINRHNGVITTGAEISVFGTCHLPQFRGKSRYAC
jgi:hypothetical protein